MSLERPVSASSRETDAQLVTEFLLLASFPGDQETVIARFLRVVRQFPPGLRLPAFSEGTWPSILKSYLDRMLVRNRGSGLDLTLAGRKHMQALRLKLEQKGYGEHIRSLLKARETE